MRIPTRNTFTEVIRFASSVERDAILLLDPPKTLSGCLPSLAVRAVNLASPVEEPFVLLTDLMDATAYPPASPTL